MIDRARSIRSLSLSKSDAQKSSSERGLIFGSDIQYAEGSLSIPSFLVTAKSNLVCKLPVSGSRLSRTAASISENITHDKHVEIYCILSVTC